MSGIEVLEKIIYHSKAILLGTALLGIGVTIQDVYWYRKGKSVGAEQTLSKMEIATVQALQEQIRKQDIEAAHAVQWASEVSKEINKLKEKGLQDAKTAEQLAIESHRSVECKLSDSELLFYQSLVKGTNPLAQP